MIKSLLTVALVGVLFLGNQAFATVVSITASTSTPSGDVALSQTVINDATDLKWRSDGHQFEGQTFTVTSGFTLDKMSFPVNQQPYDPRSTAGLSMQVDVFSVTALTDTNGPTVFSSAQTGITPSWTKGVHTWLTFDVDNVTLAPGLYGMSINFTHLVNHPTIDGGHLIGDDTGYGLLYYNGGGDLYAGGRPFRNTAPFGANDELAFVLQEAAPVPEPGSIALLAVGGLLVWRRRRVFAKRMIKSLLTVAFVAGLAAGSTAFGTVVSITASTTAPSTDVEISQPGFNDSSDIVWRSDAHQWFGQTFTVTSGFTLDKMSFAVNQEDASDRSTAGLTMKVDVFSVSTLNDQSGTTVFSSAQTGVTPSFTKGVNTWLTFDVDNVTLAPGLYGMSVDFAFLLDHPTIPGGHKIGGPPGTGLLFTNGSDATGPYVDGRAFRVPTNLSSNDDLAFVLQEIVVAPVPEPSSVILLALGGFWVWRRKQA